MNPAGSRSSQQSDPTPTPTAAVQEGTPTPAASQPLSPESEPRAIFLPTRRPQKSPNAVTFIQRNANGRTWTSHSLLKSPQQPEPEKETTPLRSFSFNASFLQRSQRRVAHVFRPRNHSSLMTYVQRSDGTTRLRTERDVQRMRRRSADMDADLLDESVPDGGELTQPEANAYQVDLLRNCNLLVSNVTQRGLSELPRAPYAFASEEACRRRNQRMDEEFLENDLRARNETEWMAMRLETLSDPSERLPEDHLSIAHVRRNYQVIRRRELRVVNTLLRRMNASKCFAQPIRKYLMMSEELGTSQEHSWELLRFRLHSRQGETVTRDELMDTYRSMVSSRRGNRQELYHNVFHYSESSQPCDGCLLSKRKTFKPQTVYPNHLLIRKFVGDTEVDDISTSENRISARVE